MDANENKEIEDLFIRDVLDQHGEYLYDLFDESIHCKNLIKSGDLLESINYRVKKSSSGLNTLSFEFEAHGRFIEIAYHKRSKNSTYFGINLYRQNSLLMPERRKKNTKKNTQWYTRNVFGSLNRLSGILMYEFTEQERKRLKGILDYQRNIKDNA